MWSTFRSRYGRRLGFRTTPRCGATSRRSNVRRGVRFVVFAAPSRARTVVRWPDSGSADRRARDMTGFDVADPPRPRQQLALTARLNTSALDSRRGVIRLHPEAIAALGLREWDAVSLTGARTTAAVVGIAGSATPVGTALLDDVTLANAGLREDSSVVVAPATVYG